MADQSNEDDKNTPDNKEDKSEQDDKTKKDEKSNEEKVCEVERLTIVDEQYKNFRELARLMMYLLDNRERGKVLSWIERMDRMVDTEDNRRERLLYARFLVNTLASPFGLVEPFTSAPPVTVKPLHAILPPVVFIDVLDETNKCLIPREGGRPKDQDEKDRLPQDDKKFYEEQLYPPEGLICYAAAFSTM